MLTLDDFDFELPESLIALRPVCPRPSSRMLVAKGDNILDLKTSDLPSLLRKGDLLVFNNTKVIPARLDGERHRHSEHGSGVAKIEATLIEKLSTNEWKALVKPAKRLKPGDEVNFNGGLNAAVSAKRAGEVVFEFDKSGTDLDRSIEASGNMPLPPYIAAKRAPDARDFEDYQSVFARKIGAVAAPTASLHFDENLLQQLSDAGILTTEVTLHVGAGTFLPVIVDNIDEHKMHAEWGEVSQSACDAINKTVKTGGRVIPVGTTALRLIETAANQNTAKPELAIAPWVGDTDIFIFPGYEFKLADGLMTNFHLPKSTLMMLVSALVGMQKINKIYSHAIENEYRFFSYGDASLLWRNSKLGIPL